MSHHFDPSDKTKYAVRDDGSRRVIFNSNKPSKTRQDHAPACDINNIVERYHRTGMVPPSRGLQPQYADVTSLQGDITERLSFSRQVVGQVADNLKERMSKKGNKSAAPTPSNQQNQQQNNQQKEGSKNTPPDPTGGGQS